MLSAAALVLTVTSVLPASAPQQPPEPLCPPGYHQVLAFPLQTRIVHPTLAAHCYVPGSLERDAVRSLRDYRCVLLQGFTLPRLPAHDLQLTRIDDVEPKFISLDGAAVGASTAPVPTAMSLWSGSIVGVPGSRVCIAFSEVGVWGWMSTDVRLYHVASFPSGGSWSAYHVLVVDDADKNLLNGSHCGDVIPEPQTLPPNFGACLAGLAPAQWRYQCPDPGIVHLRRCRVAIETDWQFYQRFGDARAAEVYARFVLGAVAQALRLDVRVVCELDYLGLWTSAADPWVMQDLAAQPVAGACCVDVFYEFQHAWGDEDLSALGPRFNRGPGLDRAPVDADVYHMMSGVQMGCAVGREGVGTIHGGFSISTGMGAVNFDNPREPRESPFFQVYGAGHEIGHSFGVGHTQDFKIDVRGTPANTADDVPIDDCAVDPDGGAPNCASTGFGQSTLMSYCINCPPAGLGNVRIQYHPESARCMRAYTAALPNFEDVHFVGEMGSGSAPAPATPPRLHYAGETVGVDRVTLVGSNNPPSFDVNLLIIGFQAMHADILGVRIVPTLDDIMFWVPASTPFDIALPPLFPNGVMVYFQQAFVVNGVDIYTSNAVAMEVIR